MLEEVIQTDDCQKQVCRDFNDEMLKAVAKIPIIPDGQICMTELSPVNVPHGYLNEALSHEDITQEILTGSILHIVI